jgi:hypothetical protein
MAASISNVSGFDLQTVTAESDRALISNNGELSIWVERKPIVTLSAIRLVKGGFSSAMTLSQGSTNYYQIPQPQSRVVFPNLFLTMTGTYMAGGSTNLLSLRGANMFYEIDYIGGWTRANCPPDLAEAITLLTRHVLNTRNNPKGVYSFKQGSYEEVYYRSNYTKSALVEEAESILINGGYTRNVVF